MKKLFLLATVALLVTGTSFAEKGKKKKKCAKGKSGCTKTEKAACKEKADKTVSL